MNLTTAELRVQKLLLGMYADAYDLPAPVDLCPRCKVEIIPGDTCPDADEAGCAGSPST